MNGQIQLSRWCHSFNRHEVTAFFNAVSLGFSIRRRRHSQVSCAAYRRATRNG